MQVLSINTGREQVIPVGSAQVKTGIFKQPIDGAVRIEPLGLQGDYIADLNNHGGPDQAVYIYGGADYAWWARELGRDIAPGTFGENLTISDLESAPIAIGDRFHIGDVMLEATSPRIPCDKFAARMGDPGWVKRFRYAERPGVYCRVIQGGAIRAGDAVTLQPFQQVDKVTVLDMYRLWYQMELDAETLRRLLAAPIDIRARQEFERRLELLNS